MNSKVFIVAAGMILTGSILFTSCIERDHYDTYPDHNNNNNSSTYTSFDEEFNGEDIHGWTFTDAADSSYGGISNGAFQYVDYSKVRSNMSAVSTNIDVQSNFTAKARLKSDNTMGLLFGASASDNGYVFYLDSAGYYSLYREGSGSAASTPIITATQDTAYAVKKDWNTLEVDQTNGTWTGYINGTQVFSMAARSVSGDRFGFKVLPVTVGYADYLQVKND